MALDSRTRVAQRDDDHGCIAFQEVSRRPSHIRALLDLATGSLALFIGTLCGLVSLRIHDGNGQWSIRVAVSIALVLALYLSLRWLGWMRGRGRRGRSLEPARVARLTCVGAADVLLPDRSRILQARPYSSLFLRVPAAFRPLEFVIVTALGLGASMCLFWLAAPIPIPWQFVICGSLWVVLGPLLCVLSYLFPTCAVVTSGKLVLVECRRFPWKPVSTREISLASARLLIDLNRKIVFIDEGRNSLELFVGLMTNYADFLNDLLVGATRGMWDSGEQRVCGMPSM